jgi:H-NS histone family
MAAKTETKVLDITKMSETEIQDYLRQRKVDQARIIAEKGKEARKDVENYCQQKWQLTLAQVWMAGDNYRAPKTYKNPTTGELYTYSGRGKVPVWLKGADNKPNPQYLVQSN